MAIVILRQLVAQLRRLDLSLFTWINQTWQMPWLDPLMKVITLLGRHRAALGLAVALALADRRRGRTIAASLVIALLLAWTIAGTLKVILRRPRPAEVLQHIRLLTDTDLRLSFPSGHATTVFTVAAVLAIAYPRLAFWAYTIALIVGISRVYLGVHYPSDVLAGAVLGNRIGCGVMRRVERWVSNRSAPMTPHPAPDARSKAT